MTDLIPFVGNPADASLLASLHSQAGIVRVSLQAWSGLKKELPRGSRLWVDGGFDGLHHPDGPSSTWWKEVSALAGVDELKSGGFKEKPDKKVLKAFVFALLDRCSTGHPHWISVPQLPMVKDGSRRKTNRCLADLSGDWYRDRNPSSQLILPAVFTHQDQINLKTQAAPFVRSLITNCKRSLAQGLWVVDTSLDDQSGSPTNQKKRFPGLVRLHQDLRAQLTPGTKVIAGPYWGIGLVLWSRGLVDHPACGVGRGYRYFIPGGQGMPAKDRLALTVLRRRAIKSAELRAWISKAMNELPDGSPALQSLSTIHSQYGELRGERLREQVATSYQQWYDSIARVPPEGRALALYQDLSSAYVIGKQLPKLPQAEGTGRDPGRIAEQYMLNCL